MISLKVVDVKGFMSNLLVHKVFDNFLLSELTIHTSNEFYISGKLNTDFFTNEELEELAGRNYITWGETKSFAYLFIKGSKPPLSIKIVFLLSGTNTEKILARAGVGIEPKDVNGLFLTVRFEKDMLHLTTGTSLRIFTLDKTLEQVWDEDVKKYLRHFEIAVEELT